MSLAMGHLRDPGISPARIVANGLHPDHLAYLRARGILDDTITAAGLHSSRPQDLPRLAGRPIPDDTSGLVIPYPNAEGYQRVRLFPPLTTADGREQKFGQAVGSAVRLFVPPGLSLDQPDAPLFIIEGELKALALWQVGFPAVALGGVWNFRTHALPPDRLIPDLEAIPWEGRALYLVPDSDAWEKDQVMLAVYRLARILEQRKAGVLVVKIPPVKGAKQGADDFLVGVAGHGKDPLAAWRRLVERAVTLGHPAFKPFREAEKAKARQLEKVSASLPPELVGRRIHPALQLDPDGFAAVGIVTIGPEGTPLTEIITSERRRYPTEAIRAVLSAGPLPYGDLVNRWPPEDVARFLDGKGDPPAFNVAAAKAITRLETLLELGRDCETVVLATWMVATYFHPLFFAFPRLDVRGERGSGKSKLLSIAGVIAFNGLLRVSPTPAVLFRLAEPLRPSLCLDEIEGLAGDEKREILAILNAGYKFGGRVDRCEGDDLAVKSWSIYCPVALAGISGLNRVTEDRAITLVLTRGKDPARLNIDVDVSDPRFAEIRDLCYRLALLRSGEVAETYRTLALPDWLVGRERELWRPLLTVASLADRESSDLGLVADVLNFAREQGQDRAGLSEESEALLSVLADKLGCAGEIIVSPGDLCSSLQEVLRWERAPRPETVGRWLKRLKIAKAPRSAGGVRYVISEAALNEIQGRAGFGGGKPTLQANLHSLTH